MWFRSYTREVRDDSSGFEHVFVGEARNGEIMGLHNWIQFSDQEQKHKLDYKGYIYPRVHRYILCSLQPILLFYTSDFRNLLRSVQDALVAATAVFCQTCIPIVLEGMLEVLAASKACGDQSSIVMDVFGSQPAQTRAPFPFTAA